MSWTTADLLSKARIYASEPDASDGGLSDADALSLANDELVSYVFPRLLAAHEEYAVTVNDQTITAAQASYSIPSNAHASRIRDILYVSSSGDQRSLAVIDPEALGTQYGNATAGSPAQVCYLQGSRVVLWPTPSTTEGTLRIKYFARPATLVSTADCLQVIHIATITIGPSQYYQLGFNSPYPSTWGTSNQTVDVIEPSGGFEYRIINANAVYVSPGEYAVLKTSFTYAPVVGDWMCLTGTSCLPQIPDALHPWLARRTATAILEVRGDRNGVKIGQSKSDEFEAKLTELLQPRVDGEPVVIVPNFSPLRSGGRFGGRWGRW